MLKLTKTGIGLLTKQYRSVLRKCLLLNLGLFAILLIKNAYSAMPYDYNSIYWYDIQNSDGTVNIGRMTSLFPDGTTRTGLYLSEDLHYIKQAFSIADLTTMYNSNGRFSLLSSTNSDLTSKRLEAATFAAVIDLDTKLYHVDNALYNYYYTFRVDEISETAEFALFLDNEKLSNVFEA